MTPEQKRVVDQVVEELLVELEKEFVRKFTNPILIDRPAGYKGRRLAWFKR